MPDPYAILSQQLDALSCELQRRQLWSSTPPSTEALASTAPFCHDSLSFNDWLQWLFIPRVKALIEQRAPLPGDCSIAPMAELSYANADFDETELVALLRAIDQGFAHAQEGRQ